MDSTVMERMATSQLGNYLEHEFKQRNWTLRVAAGHLHISKSALGSILQGSDSTPTLETITKIAVGIGLPVWRVIELCGVDLALPSSITDQAARLAALMETAPEYRSLADMLTALRPDDLEGVLTYIEMIEQRRSRRGSP